jgi:hypothetical protein
MCPGILRPEYRERVAHTRSRNEPLVIELLRLETLATLMFILFLEVHHDALPDKSM